MKKNSIKAFTLTEMLIVIVIIGILIAALLPRMQAAQGRARDVSRKTALSQVQSAIVVYQGDHGSWPGQCTGDYCGWMGVDKIVDDLKTAGMSSVPQDPLQGNVIGISGASEGQYGYLVAVRNGVKKGGFVLMAKTEVEGGSNWVYCAGTGNSDAGKGAITGGMDIQNLKTCETFEPTTGSCEVSGGTCKYKDSTEFRYLITY